VLIDISDKSIPPGGKHLHQLFEHLDQDRKRVIHEWDEHQFRLLDPDTGRVIREGKPWPAVPLETEKWDADNWMISEGEKETVLVDPETGKAKALTPAVVNESSAPWHQLFPGLSNAGGCFRL
jgi:hypothetical protein